MKLPWVPSTVFDDPLCWLGSTMIWTPWPLLLLMVTLEPVAPPMLDPVLWAVATEMVLGFLVYLVAALCELHPL
jgi:hypothetical protein